MSNDGRQALSDAELVSSFSTLYQVANATATYMSLPAPDTASADLSFVCPFACGPFVYSLNGYEPLKVRCAPPAELPPALTVVLGRSL